MNVLLNQATLGSFFIVLVIVILATVLLAFHIRKLIALPSHAYRELAASFPAIVRGIKLVSTFGYIDPGEKGYLGWPLRLLFKIPQSLCLVGLLLSIGILSRTAWTRRVQRGTVIYPVKFSWVRFALDILALLSFPLWIGVAVATAICWSALALISVMLVMLWLLVLLCTKVAAHTVLGRGSSQTTSQLPSSRLA